MELIFYICGFTAIATTVLAITSYVNPIYALLYLIISLLSIAGVFFTIGAHFVGALEIIIYAGAIMVLFIFVIMMLNYDQPNIKQKYQYFKPRTWISVVVISIVMLSVIVYAILEDSHLSISRTLISADKVSVALFGPYVLIVECASMQMLSGLLIAFHIGRSQYYGRMINNNNKITNYNVQE